jgi:sortase A
MRSARPLSAAALGTLLLVAGCGGTGASTDSSQVAAQAAETQPLEETSAPTTIVTTTTIATTTTAATTIATTAATLPQPAPAPDPNATEPELQLGTIAIPKIGMLQNLYEGVSLGSLDRGPGHWPGTAMPGQLGNVVVGGHRVSHARPFRHLEQLVPGDQILMTTNGVQYVYDVTSTQIVTPNDTWIINQTPDHTATLFACHPPGSTRERIVVFAKLAGT